jgi:NitT/TauT family transport system permease protein
MKPKTDHAGRQDFILEGVREGEEAIVQRPLGIWERLYNISFVRKFSVVLVLCFVWQAYALWLNNSLLFPTLTETFRAWVSAIVSGDLIGRSWVSIKVLLIGYGIGAILAFAFAALAITSRIGNDVLETLTSMFNPLPAIALLPLALLWFGLGTESLIFVLVHSVLWPVALNTHSGFRSVSSTLRMVGRNYGLGGIRLVGKILLPAAFPNILAGLKIGWAFAWRTLIAAELVFGVSSGSGGLGWYIFENKNLIQIPEVFAGLLTVILIGLVVENFVFRVIEHRTVHRWGMQN